MDTKTFRAFLDLMMCSDPWPVSNETSERLLLAYANETARSYGYPGWIEAFHELGKKHSTPQTKPDSG